jgi:hypothetical protein
MLLAALPQEAPFRIDQVRQAPGLMTSLFLAQILSAAVLSWAGVRRQRRLWIAAAVALVALTAVFFTLACWGTSDITKLNHSLAQDPMAALPGEPFWWFLAPLIVQLPYRMAAVHGLMAAAYGAVGIALSRAWSRPAWAGWWALLITTSPLLRGFLQNAHTRQALATLLMLPLMLRVARLVRIPMPATLLAGGASFLMHGTALANLILALAPRLVLPRPARLRREAGPNVGGRPPWRRQRAWLLAVLGVAIAMLLVFLGPFLVGKLQDYLFAESFFSTYPVRTEVLEFQRLLGVGFVGACLRRRLGWKELRGCLHTRVLALFTILYCLIQLSVFHEWFPQISFRLGDAVGLFLLVSALAWFRAHESLWMLLPAMILCLGDWGLNRLWIPEPKLNCGQDDDFLCIPDRWPDEVVY